MEWISVLNINQVAGVSCTPLSVRCALLVDVDIIWSNDRFVNHLFDIIEYQSGSRGVLYSALRKMRLVS